MEGVFEDWQCIFFMKQGLFNSLGYIHTQRAPDFFIVITCWLTQVAGSSTGVRTPSETM